MRTYYLLNDSSGDYRRADGTLCYMHWSEQGNVSFPPSFPEGDKGDFATRIEAETGLKVSAVLPSYFVSRRSFIDALTLLIPSDRLQEIAGRWDTLAAGLKLPEYVDTHDAELIAFVENIGLTVEAVVAAINKE